MIVASFADLDGVVTAAGACGDLERLAPGPEADVDTVAVKVSAAFAFAFAVQTA